MSWLPVLLLSLGAFLAGGAYSMYSQGKRPAMIIMIVLSVMAIAGGGLYAQRIVTRRHYDMDEAKRGALALAGMTEADA